MPRDQMTLLNLGLPGNRTPKLIEHRGRLRLQADLDENQQVCLERPGIKYRLVTTNDPRFLKALDALQAGGGGKANLGSEINIRNACIFLQAAQDIEINTIERASPVFHYRKEANRVSEVSP